MGFELHLGDKNLGELEETVELGRRAYFVVDARHWSFGARKLLPVAAVQDIDPVERTAHTAVDLDTLRRSPDFDPFLLSSGRYAARVGRYFDEVLGPAGPPSSDARPGVMGSGAGGGTEA